MTGEGIITHGPAVSCKFCGRTICRLSCLHALRAQQAPAKLQLMEVSQLPAFLTQATRQKVVSRELCQLAKSSAEGSEVLPRTLIIWSCVKDYPGDA